VVILLKQKNVLFLYIYKHIFFLFYYFFFFFYILAKKSIRRVNTPNLVLDNLGDEIHPNLFSSNKENKSPNGIISLCII